MIDAIPAQVGTRLARQDLQYLLPALQRLPEGSLFVQYAALITYEAREFYAQQLQCVLHAPTEPEVLRAARHSVKYLGDDRRPIDDAVDQYAALIRFNREGFQPPDRPLRMFDFLRDDFALLQRFGRPVSTLVGLGFGLGLGRTPGDSADAAKVGRTAHAVGYEVGSMTGMLVPISERQHRGPRAAPAEAWSWWDGHSEQVLPAMFAGALTAQMAGVMSAVAFGVVALNAAARSDCCLACQGAAFKQRLIGYWHARASLRRAAAGPFGLDRDAKQRIDELLNASTMPGVAIDRLRDLRNALLHFGVSDLPPGRLSAESGVADLVEAYTSETFQQLDRALDDALVALADGLELWCEAAPRSGRTYQQLLHPAPED